MYILSKLFLFSLIVILFPGVAQSQVFADELIPIDIQSTLKTDLITLDVDGDGDLDIIHRGQGFTLYANQGNFIYVNQGTIDDDINNGVVDHFDIVDWNGDGLEDIVVAIGSFPFTLAAWISSGDGSFSSEPIELNTSSNFFTDISAKDFDNDGDIDLVLNTSNVGIEWYEQVEDGTFNLLQSFSTSEVNGVCLNFVDLIDINNDGFLDLAATFNDGLLIWFENLNGNEFSEFKTIVSNGFSPFQLISYVFIDYENDGDLDVFYGIDESEGIGWVINDNGIFNFGPGIGFLGLFSGAEVGDVNNDSDTDLIMYGTLVEYELQLFSNEEAGQFNLSFISADFDRICKVYLVDLNNDTFLDLLISYIENGIELKYGVFPNLLGSPSIQGCVFFDENRNGIKDQSEQNLNGIQIRLDPEDLLLQTNEDGCYTFFVEDGTYTVSPQIPSIWELTTDSASYTVAINGNSISDLDFGFAPAETLIAGQMHTVSGITRCFRETKFDFIFQNIGTTVITDGIIWGFPDSLLTIANEINPLDTFVNDFQWGWKFENLFPGQTVRRSIELNIPGLGNGIEPGTLVTMFSATEATDTQNFTNFFKHNFESEILCAYDPNDKLVRPDREGDENYTQFKDTLIYTVRFQNTGNDTAFTVVLRDTLDENLDVSTFRLLGSSHREVLTTEILEDRFMTFTFENILLPDSTINFNGSQGFVAYSIRPIDGLPEETVIENTASIFFDFNPPIVTNTTQNTLVECLPVDAVEVEVTINTGETHTLPDGQVVSEAGAYVIDILDEEDCPIERVVTILEVLTSLNSLPLNNVVHISPNPAQDVFHLSMMTEELINHTLHIHDILGIEILSANIQSRSNRVGIASLHPGLYYLQIRSRDGKLVTIKRLMVE